MGAGASTVSLEQLSPENIGELVTSMGEVYRPYSDAIISHCVSGAVLASIEADQMKACLESLGVTNIMHQNVLTTNINKLKASKHHPPSGGSGGAGHHAQASGFHPLPSSFILKDSVTITPRSIMTQLFEIQGIAVDPTDVEVAVDRLVKTIGTGFGDGKTKFDCFINYRVNADADLAEKLYLYLLSRGVHAFLDRKCLKNGEKWKDGFLTGLKNSKTFVALISRKALERVRDPAVDHSFDNVLLEYETALDIMKATSNPQFICPLLVGECSGKVLSKFEDYSSSLYPDSVTAIPNETPKVKKAAEPKKKEPKRLHKSDTDGAGAEDQEDAVYGEIGYAEESAEADAVESLQPEGTKSIYQGSPEYYCEVKNVRITETDDSNAVLFTLDFNARGDNSLGPLAMPDGSILSVDGDSLSPSDQRLYIQDRYQCVGELDFLVSIDGKDMTQIVVTFAYRRDYHPTVLAIPDAAEREVSLPTCSQGVHCMRISDYQEGNYEMGYVCDICRQHKSGMRWFCETCSSDKCFSCEPLKVFYPRSAEGNPMERCWDDSYGSRNCDGCGRANLEYDLEFYIAREENYDLCLTCACDQYHI